MRRLPPSFRVPVIPLDDIETLIEYLVEFDNGNDYPPYRYDASGKKPQKVVKEGTAAEKTTDYVAGLAYEGNRLQFIPTSEGRILPPALADNGGACAFPSGPELRLQSPDGEQRAR